jgi:glycosyltransferase involved in cell wall biosynthesis
MRIGIDGTSLAIPLHCGTRHYAEGLITALSKIDNINEYFIFCPKNVVIPKHRNFHLISIPSFLPFFKRQTFLDYFVKRERIDVFHYLDPFGSIFFKHPKIVTTIHDIDLDAIYPRDTKYFFKQLYSTLIRFAVINHSRIFITDTHTISREVNKYINKIGKHADVVTIGLAVPNMFKVAKKIKKSKSKFFLCMCDFSPRKNVQKVINAFNLLPKRMKNEYQLKIVTSTKEAAQYFVNSYARNVEVLFNSSTQELVSLYNRSIAFIFPSLYEGFGLPILEAMACGCPVITSKYGSMKEVSGNSTLLINPKSARDIANAMQKIVNSTNFRNNLIQKGLCRARMFSWEKTARETLAIYKKLWLAS